MQPLTQAPIPPESRKLDRKAQSQSPHAYDHERRELRLREEANANGRTVFTRSGSVTTTLPHRGPSQAAAMPHPLPQEVSEGTPVLMLRDCDGAECDTAAGVGRTRKEIAILTSAAKQRVETNLQH
jgi:hypothetical protein